LLLLLACAGAARPGAPTAWPHGDPNAIVKTVLAQPAYHAEQTSRTKPPETLLEAIVRRIGDFFHWIFGSLTAALRGAQTAGAAFGIALIIALIALLIVVIARVVTVARRRRRSVAATHGADAVPLASLDAAAWLARARAAAQRGEYAAGIAALFNAALHALDERGVADFDGARTPAEYRALLRRTPGAPSGPFDRIARTFVLASFSRGTAGETEFSEASDAYAQLVGEPR
jgi:hypothetical protein